MSVSEQDWRDVPAWDWPTAEQQFRAAEYEAYERSQDRKDFLVLCCLLIPSAFFMSLGIERAIQILAGWIA